MDLNGFVRHSSDVIRPGAEDLVESGFAISIRDEY
jgi:hypothetical protein